MPGPEAVGGIISSYFSEIFTSSLPIVHVFQTALVDVKKCVTDRMNQQLLRQFTEQDIVTALKQIHPNKVPGSDGLSGVLLSASLGYYWC